MGFLDELKDRAEAFGDKVNESSGAGNDKSEDVIENTKERFDSDSTLADKADDAPNFPAGTVSDAAESMGETPSALPASTNSRQI